MILENELVFTKQTNRDYQKEYTGPTKRGATVYVKKPPRYTVRDGQNVAIQDTTITQVPVTLAHQFGVDVEFSSQDLTLSISKFGEDVLRPQISQIANTIDLTGLIMAATLGSQACGTPGTTPGTGSTAQAALAVYAQAGALLDKAAAPRDGRRALVINEDAQAVTVPNLAGLLIPPKTIGDQYGSGQMGPALGFKVGMSQNVAVNTIGAGGGTPVVAGTITPATGPTGTTLTTTVTPFAVTTSGWPNSTLVAGATDIVTFAGCYAVNPVSKQNTGKLKQFAVNAAMTSGAGGLLTLQLNEPMIVSGAYQNVTAVPANGAAVTLFGTAGTVTPQNIAFYKEAITLACVDLPLPQGVHMAARKSDDQLGISMRFVAAYEIRTDLFIGRFDVLCGWAVLRPEHIVRIAG